MRTLTYEEYQEKVKNLKTVSDVTNFAKELIAPTLQKMLEAELDNHLGYEKNSILGNNSGNNRNGYSDKKLKTSFGTENLKVPRDRNGTYEPIAVPKYSTIESDVEEKIIAMYAKGLTTRDINEYMKDIYGVDISASMVSSITDKVIPQIKQWQSRPLSQVYPIIYLDGIHFKVRDNGRIISKCVYIILGIDTKGMKDVLGFWVGENESSKFWLGVLSELKQRGVKDILIACIDGLKGFPEAIESVYPNTQIQLCIIHQIRNTVKYIPHKDRKKFCDDLKSVYRAINEKQGFDALQNMKKNWKQYEVYLNSWDNKWGQLKTFFDYPEEIRNIIYTTNTIESLNRQFRKVTKTTSLFPSDEALEKLLWLAQKDITKRWTSSVRNWGVIYAQLATIFPEKIEI